MTRDVEIQAPRKGPLARADESGARIIYASADVVGQAIDGTVSLVGKLIKAFLWTLAAGVVLGAILTLFAGRSSESVYRDSSVPEQSFMTNYNGRELIVRATPPSRGCRPGERFVPIASSFYKDASGTGHVSWSCQ